MLPPNSTASKSKAPSIWSFDSGYGSNTWEDDDTCLVITLTSRERACEFLADSLQTDCAANSATTSFPQSTQQSNGLFIGGCWNVRVEDQLRLRRLDSAIEPVTTKLNVFTVKDRSTTDYALPVSSNISETCATCEVWNITWPEKNLKCDDCRNKTSIAPEALHTFDDQPKARITGPRLEIPKVPRFNRGRKSQATSRCSACELALLIDPVKPAKCTSCNPEPGLLSPVVAGQTTKVRRSCARRPTKLPPHALQSLQDWLRDNRNNPYPDINAKRSLAEICGISEKQVNTWFTNARARGKLNSIDRSNVASEDEGGLDTRHSTKASTPVCHSSITVRPGTPISRHCSNTSDYTTPSFDIPSLTKSRRGKRKDYSQMNSVSPVNLVTSALPSTPMPELEVGYPNTQEMWQCTFCYQHIAPKSWRRHEETQHRPKRKWTCLRDGPCVSIPSRSGNSIVCAFCMTKDPSEEHLSQAHRTVECMQKSEEERTFLRPDHLRQHVKNFHKAKLWEIVRDLWRMEGPSTNEIERWTCGFCAQELKTWDIRETHIAGHFKDGLTIADWQGYNDPVSAIEASKKRRNSDVERSDVFTKLARTLTTGPSPRQRQQQQELPFMSAFDSNPMSGPSVSVPLLPDMVFDSFMAEMCGNPLDGDGPIATSSSIQYPVLSDRCDSAFPEDGDMDLELDAFLNHDSSDFQAFWENSPK